MPIQYYIYLCLTLFSIGIIGVLTRRNAIIVFMCVELMLNAVNLLLVAFSKMHHLRLAAANPMAGSEGQLFVFFIMVVAAAEVSVGLPRAEVPGIARRTADSSLYPMAAAR